MKNNEGPNPDDRFQLRVPTGTESDERKTLELAKDLAAAAVAPQTGGQHVGSSTVAGGSNPEPASKVPGPDAPLS